MARKPCSTQSFECDGWEVCPAASGPENRRVRPDQHAGRRAVLARMRDRVDALLGVASRCCHDLVGGRLPTWVLFGLVIPAAYVSFGLGVGLSLAGLPRGFDYGRCVISRLCS